MQLCCLQGALASSLSSSVNVAPTPCCCAGGEAFTAAGAAEAGGVGAKVNSDSSQLGMHPAKHRQRQLSAGNGRSCIGSSYLLSAHA